MHVNVNARAISPTQRPEMPHLNSGPTHCGYVITGPVPTPAPRPSSPGTGIVGDPALLPLFPSCQALVTYKVRFPLGFEWGTIGVLPGLVMSRQRAHCVVWNPGGVACASLRVSCRRQVHEYGRIACKSTIDQSRDNVWLLHEEFKFVPDVWNDVALGIVMNSVGQTDGVLTLKINSVCKTYDKMVWRSSPDSRILGLAADSSTHTVEIKEVHIESRECTPIQMHTYTHPTWIISPYIQQWGLWVWGSGVFMRRVRTSFVHGSACVRVMYVAHRCGPNAGLNVYLPVPWGRDSPIMEIHYDVFFPHGFSWNGGGILFGLGVDACPGWTPDGYVALHDKRIGPLRCGSWNSIRVSRMRSCVSVDVNGKSGDDLTDYEPQHTVALVSWHTKRPLSTMHAYFRNIRVF